MNLSSTFHVNIKHPIMKASAAGPESFLSLQGFRSCSTSVTMKSQQVSPGADQKLKLQRVRKDDLFPFYLLAAMHLISGINPGSEQQH